MKEDDTIVNIAEKIESLEAKVTSGITLSGKAFA